MTKDKKKLANLYFWPELGGKCKKGWVLHHINPELKTTDPERYEQWNVEDLIPMTRKEHQKFHASNKTTEWREKISKANKGRTFSDEYKEKQSIRMSGENNPMYGKKLSEERVKQLKEINTGHVTSEETKQKISAKLKGRKRSEETKQKIRNTVNKKWALFFELLKDKCGN